MQMYDWNLPDQTWLDDDWNDMWFNSASTVPYTKPKPYTNFWTWKSWGTWGSVDTSTIQERIERKKDINKELDKFKEQKNIIAKKYIWWKLGLTRHNWIYSITMPNSKKYKEDINSLNWLYRIWNKYPTSRIADKRSTFISQFVESEAKWDYAHLFQNWDLPEDKLRENYDKFRDLIRKSFINDDDLEKLISYLPPKIKHDIEARKHWWAWNKHNEARIHRDKNKLKITPKPNKVIKEVSLTRWKRMNRWYINHTDYRCLVNRRVEKNKIPKILFLIDWSWSMNSERAYKKAINFMADISQTKLFTTQMLISSDVWVQDITDWVKEWSSWKKDTVITNIWGPEWFEKLTSRTSHLFRDEDYVVILTDMCVPRDAEDNLKMFIWSKKHLVLSFWDKRQFDNLNVRYVKEFKDMKNSITTLLWH